MPAEIDPSMILEEKMNKRLTGLLAAAIFALGTAAASAKDTVEVDHVWIRATVPGQKVAAAYLDITSPVAAKLVAARSPAAAIVELHTMSMHDGVMEMRQVEDIALPAKHTIHLAPGGYHVMLINLKKPLKAGEKVPLTLVVEGADKHQSELPVTATVRDAVSGKAMEGMKGMDMKGMGGMEHHHQ